jgi:hypothetical protein
MRRLRAKWVVVGTVGAVLAGAGVVVADVVGTAQNPLQFKLISRATAINNFIDTGPAGPSTGDLYVFTDQVFRQSAPSTPIGTFEGHCILFDPSTAHWDCSVVTTLPDGTIRGDGALTFVEGSKKQGRHHRRNGALSQRARRRLGRAWPIHGPAHLVLLGDSEPMTQLAASGASLGDAGDPTCHRVGGP